MRRRWPLVCLGSSGVDPGAEPSGTGASLLWLAQIPHTRVRARRSHLPPAPLSPRRPTAGGHAPDQAVSDFRVCGLTLGAILFVMPFFWMVSTSLQLGRYHPRARLSQPGRAQDHARQRSRDLARPVRDYLDAGQSPPFLMRVYTQLEDSKRQRGFTLSDYLRTQRSGMPGSRSTSTSRSSTNCGPRAAIT